MQVVPLTDPWGKKRAYFEKLVFFFASLSQKSKNYLKKKLVSPKNIIHQNLSEKLTHQSRKAWRTLQNAHFKKTGHAFYASGGGGKPWRRKSSVAPQRRKTRSTRSKATNKIAAKDFAGCQVKDEGFALWKALES